MPVAKIQLPDGRIARLDVPEGTTQEQVMQFVSQNQAQFAQPQPEQPRTRRERRESKRAARPPVRDPFEGLPADITADIEARFPLPEVTGERSRAGSGRGSVINDRRQAAELEQIRLINPFLAEQIEETGGLEAFAVGAGRGLTNIGRAVGLADLETDIERQAIEGLKTQTGAVTAGEIVGESAPFLAVGGPLTGLARTVGQRALAGATLGATEGGLVTAGRGGDAKQIVLATLLGGVTGGFAPVVGARAGGVRRGPDDVVPPIQRPADLDDNAIVQAVEDLNLSEVQRRQVFEALDVKPTRAQVTRDPTLFQEQQEAFKRTGDVRAALERQDKILSDRVSGNIDATGGIPQRAPESVINSITDKATALDAKISDLYKLAREAAPGAKNVRFSGASKVLREKSPIDTRTDGTVSAIRDEMKRLGFLDEKAKPTRLVSVEASENLRQFTNSLFDGANPQARTVIREFKDAMDDDVFRAAGQDVFKEARRSKAEFERGLDTTKKNKFDKRQVSLVRDLLDGSLQGDDVAKAVISRSSKYKPKDLKELKSYLGTGTEGQIAQGTQAWNDIRAAALNQIKESAFKGPIDQAGVKTLTRAGLESGLRAIGPQKMQILFTKKEQEFLKSLSSLSVLKEAPSGTALGLGPSAQAINRVESLLSRIPVLGDMAADVIRNRIDSKNLLKVNTAAEEIIAQSEKQFQQRLSKSRAPLLPVAGATIAIPAAAQEETQ